MKLPVTITINGRGYQREIEPRLLLVHFLRDVAGLTGTKIGCDTSQCGACTVLLDGVAMKACTCLAAQADGRDVLTVEGLEQNGQLHPIQEGFWQEHGLQCGFCTPGILMTLTAELRDRPSPTEQEVRDMLAGNLCRCTGYQGMIDAVLALVESGQPATRPEGRSTP